MDEINSKLYIFEEKWNELEMELRNVFRIQDRGKQRCNIKKTVVKRHRG